jgi:threonine/homoserine/homoserine lactone efflux protein
MWFSTILALGVSVLLWTGSRAWRDARSGDLGWMSQQWLEEHRAGER